MRMFCYQHLEKNLLGCTNCLTGLKRINCLESFCINKVDLLNTSQLLGIVTTVLQSAQCLVFCSCFSDSHLLTYMTTKIRWKFECRSPCFERTTCRSIFVQLLPCSWKPKPWKVPTKAWTLKVGLGKVQQSWALKHLTGKKLSSLLWQLFLPSSRLFFSQRCRKLLQVCISSYFIIQKTPNAMNSCLLSWIFNLTYMQFSCFEWWNRRKDLRWWVCTQGKKNGQTGRSLKAKGLFHWEILSLKSRSYTKIFLCHFGSIKGSQHKELDSWEQILQEECQ